MLFSGPFIYRVKAPTLPQRVVRIPDLHSVKYFEKIGIESERKESYAIPEVRYCFYKYILPSIITRISSP
jgi:hypothetical protein